MKFRSKNIEHDEKMSIGWVYSGLCCPWHSKDKRWTKWKGVKNSKRKTLRSYRDGRHKTNNFPYTRMGINTYAKHWTLGGLR